MPSRNTTLDLFKGIAIIAVILYHAGLLTYGYLGVEIFLVIGGYLITKSIVHTYEKGDFSYWNYLCKRLVRLWPLALIITVLSLVGGYFTMLPDAYKNTCETAIGSATFTNNFVQYITAGNYWDTSNDYKPLMHTWYLGVIFQFYILYPLVFMLCHGLSHNFIKTSRKVLVSVFFLSLAFYLFPKTDTAADFYLLPSRLFEFAVGGILALPAKRSLIGNEEKVFVAFLILAGVLMGVNEAFNMMKVRLLLAVFLAALVILYSERNVSMTLWGQKICSVLAMFGAASYSLYLWHQVVLAFWRYDVSDEFSFVTYVVVIMLSLIIGLFSYRFVENKITSFAKTGRYGVYKVMGACLVTTCITSVFALKYYRTQGVVQDIPELDVRLDTPSSWAPQEYNARITEMFEKPLPVSENGKKKVLVVGDSYARDWINVLLEGGLDNVNLLYAKDVPIDLRERIAWADVIFVANNAPIDRYVDYLPAMMQKKFYRVGHKAFGRGIGCAYNQARLTNNYSSFVVSAHDAINEEERIEFSGMYINLMDSLRNADGSISLFTTDKKLISHDGIHLTRAGAQELAKRINVRRFVEEYK